MVFQRLSGMVGQLGQVEGMGSVARVEGEIGGRNEA